MPASVTSATLRPASSSSRTLGIRSRSFASKKERKRARAPMRFMSRPARRVSSAATTSTSDSTRRARSVRSSRLPIGVPTTNRVPRALTTRIIGRPQHGPGTQAWGADYAATVMRTPDDLPGTPAAPGLSAEPHWMDDDDGIEPVVGTRAARHERRPSRARNAVLIILAVTAFAAGLRLYHLSRPHAFVFDEVYYAKDACYDAGFPFLKCGLD